MGLYEIVCETSQNCKALQNLKNLSFNFKNGLTSYYDKYVMAENKTLSNKF